MHTGSALSREAVCVIYPGDGEHVPHGLQLLNSPDLINYGGFWIIFMDCSRACLWVYNSLQICPLKCIPVLNGPDEKNWALKRELPI